MGRETITRLVDKKYIDFSKPPCVYWSNAAKITHLQRRIIIYSIMYYELNESCVSDFFYDGISHQLVELQNSYPEEHKKSMYFYAMKDFDGNTGFDIRSKLNKTDLEYLTNLAYRVWKQWKESQT